MSGREADVTVLGVEVRRTVGLTAVGMGLLMVGTGCTSNGNSCADRADQIDERESTTPIGDPSWDSVQATSERSIERDSLRAQMADQDCG